MEMLAFKQFLGNAASSNSLILENGNVTFDISSRVHLQPKLFLNVVGCRWYGWLLRRLPSYKIMSNSRCLNFRSLSLSRGKNPDQPLIHTNYYGPLNLIESLTGFRFKSMTCWYRGKTSTNRATVLVIMQLVRIMYMGAHDLGVDLLYFGCVWLIIEIKIGID